MSAIAESNRMKLKIMRLTLLFSCLLMAIKFTAYFLTHSVAILSDALESVINITTGIFALFSIYYAAKPRDSDHPYGHGKIENISAGFEGGLIFIAGISIIVKGVFNFIHPVPITQLDLGVFIAGLAGALNFFMGYYLIRKGKGHNSFTMEANGRHLLFDAISSLGLILGLAIIIFTEYYFLDSLIALVFGLLILWTGFKLMRQSVFNLLDKTDMAKLTELAKILEENRRPAWIDIHNLRILKYGSGLHIDAHITLPWYATLEEAHDEMKALENIVKEKMGNEVEIFLHPDPCLPDSCPVCTIKDCKVRKNGFVKKIHWSLDNLLPDKKHGLK